jgi:phosphorylated CTD-interacting factor 1
LKDNLNVNTECFASPLNCTLTNSYYSGFYDVDRFFGSKGSFFSIGDLKGSFEANPPFIEEIMYMMTLHILDLLKNSTDSMSFFIILPGLNFIFFSNKNQAWKDTKTFELLFESEFKRLFLKFLKNKHTYVDGSQHQAPNHFRLSKADSFVFLLQNEKGKQELTEEKIEEIKTNFK